MEKNWKKHSVYYREAEEVFLNKPLIILKDARHSRKEDRFIAYGVTNNSRALFLVFTVRIQKIRIISVRDQSRKERRYYEKDKSDSKV